MTFHPLNIIISAWFGDMGNLGPSTLLTSHNSLNLLFTIFVFNKLQFTDKGFGNKGIFPLKQNVYGNLSWKKHDSANILLRYIKFMFRQV